MTQRDLNDADAKFEQWLLDSGRNETLPVELTERAWKRFAKTSGQVAAGAMGVAAVNELAARASLVKWAWLAVGIALGSAGTLAVTARTPHTPAAPLSPSAANTVAPPEQKLPVELPARAAAPASRAAPPGAQPPLPAPRPAPPDSQAQSALRAPRPAPPDSRDAPAAAALRAQGSSLADEVRALDAARQQIEAGHPELALEAVSAFHRDFPRAQLAADAEGLAIEALLAQNDREAAALRARRFLRDYPGDPHATRFEPIATDR